MASKRDNFRREVRKDTADAIGYLLERMPPGVHTVTAVANTLRAATPVLVEQYATIGAATLADVRAGIGKHMKIQGAEPGAYIIIKEGN